MNDKSAITKWCLQNNPESERYLQIILDLCRKNKINWSKITQADKEFVVDTARWLYEEC